MGSLALAHVDFLDEQIETLSTDITRRVMTLEAGAPPTPAAQAADGKPGAPDASTEPLSFARAVSVLDTITVSWPNVCKSAPRL